MANCWKRFVGCWRPSSHQYEHMRRDEDSSVGGEDDALLWCRDLEKHYFGEFSFAVLQANQALEDYSQVETGKEVTFAGVYDGHGGPNAAEYIAANLFRHLVRLAREQGTFSEDILENAFSATEDGFLTYVNTAFEVQPLLASHGSCCLVGIIWKGTLYIANLGDSRAVLGVLSNNARRIRADQLTREHNAAFAEVREELRSLHPDDSNIVSMRNGAWRVKGIIQVSRSIGDAYLKRPELALGPSFPRFHLPEALTRPVLRSDPSVFIKNLNPNDKFLILASDGLWEHLSNQKAVEIVHSNPRPGIARRLIKTAMMEVARKANVSYDRIKQARKGARRSFHDDITVIVIFIDHQMLEEGVPFPVLSVQGFGLGEPSNVNIEQGMEVNPSSVGQSSEAGPSSVGQSSEAGPSSVGQSSDRGKSPLCQSSEAGPSSVGQTSEAGQSSLAQTSEAGAQTSEAGQSSLAQTSEAGAQTSEAGQSSSAQTSEAGAQTSEAGQSSSAQTSEAGAQTSEAGKSSLAQTSEAGQSSSAQTSEAAGQSSLAQTSEGGLPAE